MKWTWAISFNLCTILSSFCHSIEEGTKYLRCYHRDAFATCPYSWCNFARIVLYNVVRTMGHARWGKLAISRYVIPSLIGRLPPLLQHWEIDLLLVLLVCNLHNCYKEQWRSKTRNNPIKRQSMTKDNMETYTFLIAHTDNLLTPVQIARLQERIYDLHTLLHQWECMLVISGFVTFLALCFNTKQAAPMVAISYIKM